MLNNNNNKKYCCIMLYNDNNIHKSKFNYKLIVIVSIFLCFEILFNI